jgi:hypothetical protein
MENKKFKLFEIALALSRVKIEHNAYRNNNYALSKINTFLSSSTVRLKMRLEVVTPIQTANIGAFSLFSMFSPYRKTKRRTKKKEEK